LAAGGRQRLQELLGAAPAVQYPVHRQRVGQRDLGVEGEEVPGAVHRHPHAVTHRVPRGLGRDRGERRLVDDRAVRVDQDELAGLDADLAVLRERLHAAADLHVLSHEAWLR
jgi:hypothetical protein